MSVLQLRKKGCPNCQTDSTSEVRSVGEFKEFESLTPVGEFGKCTELFSCSVCSSKYIQVKRGHLLHLLTPAGLKIFANFFSEKNSLPHDVSKVLDEIGSPTLSEGQKEYPARIVTKDGEVIEHAVIRFMEYIWPISLSTKNVRFVADVKEVTQADDAMTLAQRAAAYSAPEIQMGTAPIWLKKNDEIFMAEHGQYFIPKKNGRPEEFEIEPNCSSPKPRFESVPYTVFIVPVV